MLQSITSEQFPQVYALMQRSFPPSERREEAGQRALLSRPDYAVWGLVEEGKVLGFITLYDLGSFLFAEHLAVDPEQRNRGLGHAILTQVMAWGREIVLEVELPDTELARRRIGFYRRNGFSLTERPYLQPPLASGQPPVPLFLMSTCGTMSQERFDAVRTRLHRDAYGVSEY